MDEDKWRGFEPQKFATFMFYGAVAFGLALLIAAPVAFGQEGRDSSQRFGAALCTDGPKDAKKKDAKRDDYKAMKKEQKPAASTLPRSDREPTTENTIGPGDCPVNPCTPPTNW